jgi:hypothetical protein
MAKWVVPNTPLLKERLSRQHLIPDSHGALRTKHSISIKLREELILDQFLFLKADIKMICTNGLIQNGGF